MRSTKINTRIMRSAALGLATAAIMSSCSPVKEYQKSRLNDGEMALANRKVEKQNSVSSLTEKVLPVPMQVRVVVAAAVINS